MLEHIQTQVPSLEQEKKEVIQKLKTAFTWIEIHVCSFKDMTVMFRRKFSIFKLFLMIKQN